MHLRLLAPPSNPVEAINGRRNPCYGFAAVIDLQEEKNHWSFFVETCDKLLKIIDPEREKKPHPIHSPLYIKQKFFHGSVFGSQPLLDPQEFMEIYANENGLLSKDVLDNMCLELRSHLQTMQPCLDPMGCEFIDKDGAILARFAYKTIDKDEAPLLTLINKLDPDKKFSRWYLGNRLRDTTVAVTICVIDKDKMTDKLDAIKDIIKTASQKLIELGKIDITQFLMINYYDKRTLSRKHISPYAVIKKDNLNMICSRK